MIAQGIDAKKYQLLLIKKAVGTRLYSMANSFNHSSLKKRITMMLKKEIQSVGTTQVPVCASIGSHCRGSLCPPEISSELDEISAVKVNDLNGNYENRRGLKVPKNNPAKEIKVQGRY